jgi:hypothetical protein
VCWKKIGVLLRDTTPKNVLLQEIRVLLCLAKKDKESGAGFITPKLNSVWKSEWGRRDESRRPKNVANHSLINFDDRVPRAIFASWLSGETQLASGGVYEQSFLKSTEKDSVCPGSFLWQPLCSSSSLIAFF